MSNSKKTKIESTENTIDKTTIEPITDIMSLEQVRELVDSILSLVFLKTDDGIVYMPLYEKVIYPYWKMGFYYPSLKISEMGFEDFYIKWINGEYNYQLDCILDNEQATFIDTLISDTIEFYKKQYQQPVINSLTNLINTVNILAQKYVNDIDNIGSSDIKGFLQRFMEFTAKNNTATITDEVLNRHGAKPPAQSEKVENAVAVQVYNEIKKFVKKLPDDVEIATENQNNE